ncbi:MAG TPA: hypothetical protein VF171_03715 [Trueperaceae bacterium]
MGDYSQDEMDHIWVEYQRQGRAECPYDGAELEFQAMGDADGDEFPEISVHCPSCGRTATGQPDRYHPHA